ncbi:unnamed protein product [Clonostachys solani]|uniref:Uncharacterized protein n=1 Tax=Clonostachys solani TaxID=160281 RepID=A0A9N9ZEJ6_9HYPO|nr:unnamed protein product [Clonostachys solani]
MIPRIVAVSLQHLSFFDDDFTALFADLGAQADIQWGKEPAAALDLLQQNPAPSAVLITDATLTQRSSHIHVWYAILSYVRQGGTAIAMGDFSSFAKPNDIGPFFARAGLTWQAGAYHRTDVALNSELATTLVPDLSTRFSMKALFLKGVEPAAVLYGPDQRSFTQSVVFPSEKVQDLTEAAIAFAQVGDGKVGYVGDVNRERETDAAIVAMCLRARPNASLA